MIKDNDSNKENKITDSSDNESVVSMEKDLKIEKKFKLKLTIGLVLTVFIIVTQHLFLFFEVLELMSFVNLLIYGIAISFIVILVYYYKYIITEDNDSKRKKIKSLYTYVDYAFIIPVFFIVFALIYTYIFSFATIRQTSMVPSFNDGDRILYSRNVKELDRFDVVTIDGEKENIDSDIIKRIIGLPGETIEYRNNELYVDGELVVDPYIQSGLSSTCSGDCIYIVPTDSYFVLGDNRAGSRDSRDLTIGYVKEDSMMGKVFFRFYPFDVFGKIE